jgi:putative ABC transport system permease protein
LRGRGTLVAIPSNRFVVGNDAATRARGLAMFDSIVRDIRFALRTLRQYPIFTVVAVLTIGLGIGATAAIFSVVDGVLLRSLDYDAPQQLVQLVGAGSGDNQQTQYSFPDFRDLRTSSRSLTEVASFRYWLFNLSGGDHPESTLGIYVGDSIFDVLRVHPAMGRLFTSGTESTSYPEEAVISDRIWHERFNADRAIVGKAAIIDGKPRTIVGVLPAKFQFPDLVPSAVPMPSHAPDVYLPLGHESNNDLDNRGNSNYWVIARIRPGAETSVATDLGRIAHTLAHDHPDQDRDLVFRGSPLQEQITAPARRPISILFGAVLFVLMIACANVGGLLLARSAQREREIGIRTALGASPGRLARQLLTESVLLALIGGVVGILLATWGVALLRAIAPNNIPRVGEIAVNGRVLLFAVVAAAVTGMLFGLAPILQQRGSGPIDALREGSRGTSHRGLRKMRAALVIGEVALAVMLLTGAGLLLRSFSAIATIDPGVDPRNVMTMITLLTSRFDDATSARFDRDVVTQLNRIPGVVSAASINTLPMSNLGNSTTAEAVEHPYANVSDLPSVGYRTIGGAYFATMRIPFIDGHDFDALRDTAKSPAPVAILNQAAARLFFPDGNPVGRKIRVMNGDTTAKVVIGVVHDVHGEALDQPAKPEVYYPFAQGPDPIISLAIRTQGDPHLLLPKIRHAIAGVDADQAFYAERTMDDLMAASVAVRRFSLTLVAGFAVLALLLSAVGLYGVIAFSVAQRTRELGIRAALGAERGGIMALVLKEGGFLAVSGLVVGFAGSIALSRVLNGMLFKVGSNDPLTRVGVLLFLGAVVMVACAVPAMRAARVDPVEALRRE